MSAQEIGQVRAGSGKSYTVKWESRSHEVYVSWAGWTKIGEAVSAGDAMRLAEAWLYNK